MAVYGRSVAILGPAPILAIAGGALAAALLLWWIYRRRRPSRNAAPRPRGSQPDRSLHDLVSLAVAASGDSAKITFAPRDAIGEWSRAFRQDAQAKGVRFKIAIAPPVPRRIRADRPRIAAALTTLLENAVAFTEEGVVRLEVAMTRDALARAWLRFTVLDTGAGVDSETLARLLSADETGHGLSLARRAVEEMGGRMAAESEPRGGSTFSFSVPVEVVEPARPVARMKLQRPELPADIPASAPLLPLASKPSRRILVVEHEMAVQVAVLWGLRTLGYSGEAVSSGAAALETWRHTPFDLVLLDWAALDAPETAQRIRRLETGCVPILGFAAPDDQPSLSASAAIDGYLPKPVCLLELARTLDRWLGAAGPAYASEASSERLSLPV